MALVGHVKEIARYPVKSMAGIPAQSAFAGWHGLAGDRRFAFRRVGDESGFPWLSASRLAELVLYRPDGLDEEAEEPLATHVITPSGERLELRSTELREQLSRQFGSDLEIMNLKHGIFDDAAVSIIATATIDAICADAEVPGDARRFRPNILLESVAGNAFVEDAWVGGTLLFGEEAAVAVTARDIRCMMINLDPNTAEQNAKVLKSAVRSNQNNAGVYGTVVRTGTIRVGQAVTLVPSGLSV